MKTYTYFQHKPVGITEKGSFAVNRDDAEKLLKQIIYKHPDEEEYLDDDIVKIKDTGTFSNGVKVTIEAQEWVISELRKRVEIWRQEIKELT